MATIDEQIRMGEVPVREGEYGERVATVEPGGVEYIAEEERHGRPLQMFWTWMSPNLEFATVFVGCVGIFLFGGSFWTVALAIVVGTALGALAHGVLSSWGPKFGVPQMVQGRSAFGFFGNILPAGLMSITAGIGWFAVNSVSGAFALSALFGAPAWATLVLIVLIQIAVAFFGHNLVHVFERYAFIPLAVVFALASLFIFAHSNPGHGFDAKAPLAFGGETGAFLLTAAAAFGYAAGWNPYASDYTRYFPTSVDRRQVGLWAGLGVLVSCVVLELAGAALVTVAGTKWLGTNPTAQLALAMPDILYKATLLCIALGAISANALNIYSGAMAFLTVGLKLPLTLRRALVALVFGAIGFVVALTGLGGASTNYENFLLLISYWIAPWLGVVFTNYWLRRGDISDAELYNRRRENWSGPVAMLVGIVISVFFFSAQAVYTGPVPKAVPQVGDLTFLVGFIVSALVYYALNARLRQRAARPM